MVFVAATIGGTFGFLSFLIAWLGFDYRLLSALGVYFSVGTGSAFMLLAYAVVLKASFSKTLASETGCQTPAAVKTWSQDALLDLSDAEAARRGSRLRSAGRNAA